MTLAIDTHSRKTYLACRRMTLLRAIRPPAIGRAVLIMPCGGARTKCPRAIVTRVGMHGRALVRRAFGSWYGSCL